MLLSYRWLSKILRNCPPPLALAEKLTMSGIEVENINDFGMISGKMVYARIESVEKHPEAPQLTVCQVDAGAYGKLQVVCGAPNVRPGMIGVLAREGAEIAGGQTVKRTRIKGEASEGMLCSGAEIRWNSDHEGILDLPEDSPVGEPVDCVFNIKITPNRPDLLSVFGVARDIAALEGRELYASQPRLREAMDAISGSVQVTVKDKRACPRYSCRLLRKCKVRKSPLWMRRALESMGLRSINNIVDVTNYVLLEYGHPLHAFDLDKIVNKHIIVRMALEGELLTLLDGRKLILTPEDLVIGDQDRVIALAGVMGGANSEISEATINVLIESAYFEPITIRRTSQRHGLVTDSSYRFERGADYRQPPLSLNRATQLMAELTDAEVLKGVIDTGTSADQIEPITMNIPRACMILGCDLTPRSMADRLVHLGFETVRSDREQLVVRRPSFRNDVARDVDLIEEIARVHGYNAIPESTPYLPAIPFIEPPERRVRHELRRMMQAADFWEVINYSFVGRDLLEKCKAPTANVVELLKPLTADQAVMRPSLLPSLIQNAHTNQRYERGSLRLYEIGKIYEKIARQGGQAPADASDSDSDKPEGPYHEEYRWGLILTGIQGADRWRNKTAEEMDFFHVKGVLEMALRGLGIQNLTTVETTAAWLHPGRAAELRDGGETVVVFGELHPEIVRAMELRGRIMVAEARMEAIERKVRPQKAMAPLARFPKVDRDIALVAPRSTPSASLEAAIRQTGGDLLEEVRLFDRYEGERIESDKVSLAYSMSFRAPDRTLREEEADEVVRGIVARLESEFSATLRTE